MRILLLIFVVTLLPIVNASSQDIHLSHLHAGPILYNPAMTGLYNADVRFIANYRSQWQNVGDTNYGTCYGSAEIKTRRLFRTSSAMGFGLEVFSDGAGDLNFSQRGVQLSMSGIMMLDGYRGKKLFSGAIKAGYIHQSYDPTKIVAFDEEVALNKDGMSNLGYFDLSAGLAWMHQLDDEKNSYYLGVSASHINRPEVSYNLAESKAVGNELYRRIVVHGGGDFVIKNKIGMQPSFIFMDQGPNREMTAGTFFSYNNRAKGSRKKKDADISIFLGAWVRGYLERDVRGIDAVIFSAKTQFSNTTITFSYDMNISSLAVASIGRGGPEISFIQMLNFRKSPNQRIMCPAFY